MQSFYSVLMTEDVATVSAFYIRHLGFEPTFESDWYVSLHRDGHELAVLDCSHETVPAAHRGRVSNGILLNLEVDDVDAEFERLVTANGLTLALPLRTEDFGQRHFIVEAPDGVLIDVITPIEPVGDYVAQFVNRIDE
ncbi:glyoxalase [Rhodococcoides trifolii]|uniref:Glyoxalase n=1 Tax=Rhodococcoides trifolii TaxID=908250 RepID=A0A917G2T0_9NOCA|nr:VOC family protein [Rhodococcus trifolii]GGG20318.1 glyoxalase [Rhodococcus trifolii]